MADDIDDNDVDDDLDEDAVDELDEEEVAEIQLKANNARIARTSAKRARRKLAKELGFDSVGDMKAANKQPSANPAKDDKGDDDDQPSDTSVSDAAVAKANQQQRLSTVTIGVAKSGIDPAKIGRAAQIVASELGDDEFDADDLLDAIDALRVDESGWFPGSDGKDGGDSTGRGVAGAKPQRRKVKTKNASEAVTQFERMKKQRASRQLLNR